MIVEQWERRQTGLSEVKFLTSNLLFERQNQFNFRYNMSEKRVFKVCLTGGPCAGKTTALSRILEAFTPEFTVYTLPELATMTFSSGVSLLPSNFTNDTHKVLTEAICTMQVNLETYFETIAQTTDKKVLIVTDRGVCDNFVYCSPENKQRVLTDRNWTMNDVCNERYDMVVHMVTAANGALEFFTYANNVARWESVEGAIANDVKGQKEWMGHPNFVLIDNSKPGFEAKIQRVLSTIASLIGAKPQLQVVKKYLLPTDFDFGVIPTDTKHQEFTELTDYLLTNSEGKHNSIIKRVYKDQTPPVHIYISRIAGEDANRKIETHKIITAKHYADYQSQTDPNHETVHKEVAQFVQQHNNEISLYRIERVSVRDKTCCILKVIRDCEGQALDALPASLNIIKDITGNHDYYSWNFSKARPLEQTTDS